MDVNFLSGLLEGKGKLYLFVEPRDGLDRNFTAFDDAMGKYFIKTYSRESVAPLNPNNGARPFTKKSGMFEREKGILGILSQMHARGVVLPLEVFNPGECMFMLKGYPNICCVRDDPFFGGLT